MSVILNAMALVVVSKMQELVPVSGRVSSDNSSKPENSNSWLALTWKRNRRREMELKKASHKGIPIKA